MRATTSSRGTSPLPPPVAARYPRRPYRARSRMEDDRIAGASAHSSAALMGAVRFEPKWSGQDGHNVMAAALGPPPLRVRACHNVMAACLRSSACGRGPQVDTRPRTVTRSRRPWDSHSAQRGHIRRPERPVQGVGHHPAEQATDACHNVMAVPPPGDPDRSTASGARALYRWRAANIPSPCTLVPGLHHASTERSPVAGTPPRSGVVHDT